MKTKYAGPASKKAAVKGKLAKAGAAKANAKNKGYAKAAAAMAAKNTDQQTSPPWVK